MPAKRKIELFTVDCPLCDETLQMIRRIACDSCEVQVLNLFEDQAAKRAQEIGIRSIPAVAVDGELANCCAGRGVDEAVLRVLGVGQSH